MAAAADFLVLSLCLLQRFTTIASDAWELYAESISGALDRQRVAVGCCFAGVSTPNSNTVAFWPRHDAQTVVRMAWSIH